MTHETPPLQIGQSQLKLKMRFPFLARAINYLFTFYLPSSENQLVLHSHKLFVYVYTVSVCKSVGWCTHQLLILTK